MKAKIEAFKESLKEDISVNRKEYILTIAVCILGGILFGFLFSPKKTSIFGSYNGNGYPVLDDEDEEKERA